uniref:Uncharacterized protein n=1 Tax=Rhizophora mucronata TaxID=61149 RepID=A0A2P2PLG5_RHIMU
MLRKNLIISLLALFLVVLAYTFGSVIC